MEGFIFLYMDYGQRPSQQLPVVYQDSLQELHTSSRFKLFVQPDQVHIALQHHLQLRPVAVVPIGLTSSSITTTSATVSWTAVSGAVTYNLQWKLSSSSTWTTVTGITTTFP
jgi:hypothetical protein